MFCTQWLTDGELCDDLEKLVEKSLMVRDELQFIVESADQLAERLSQAVTGVVRPEEVHAETKPSETKPPSPASENAKAPSVTPFPARNLPSSRAEKELMQALKNLS